jgi:CelD/BcsL family acetyltransferase involved in cellulose biosynthesis
MHINHEIAKRMNLRVERLRGPEAWADITAEWESLDAQIFPRTPFTSPLWIDLWWDHFRRRQPLLCDEFFGHIMRDASGRLVAIAPLMKTHCPGFGPLGMRIVQFYGTDPSITELRGVICRPDHQDKVIQVLAEHFRQRRGEWDVFRWNGLRKDASAYNTLVSCGEFIADRELPDYVLVLPESWDKLRSNISTNMRKNVRKAYEFLERDGYSFVFRVVERPEDVQAALERFLILHAERSEAAGMINHPNKFATPHNRAFLFDYVRRMAEGGHLRLFELEIGGTVIASRLAFLLESDLYMYFAGYDPSWRKYSVMTVLVSEIIKWAIEHGLQRVNLSTGNDQSKLRWKPDEVIFRDAIQISPTPRGRFVFQAFKALSRIRRTTY